MYISEDTMALGAVMQGFHLPYASSAHTSAGVPSTHSHGSYVCSSVQLKGGARVPVRRARSRAAPGCRGDRRLPVRGGGRKSILILSSAEAATPAAVLRLL